MPLPSARAASAVITSALICELPQLSCRAGTAPLQLRAHTDRPPDTVELAPSPTLDSRPAQRRCRRSGDIPFVGGGDIPFVGGPQQCSGTTRRDQTGTEGRYPGRRATAFPRVSGTLSTSAEAAAKGAVAGGGVVVYVALLRFGRPSCRHRYCPVGGRRRGRRLGPARAITAQIKQLPGPWQRLSARARPASGVTVYCCSRTVSGYGAHGYHESSRARHTGTHEVSRTTAVRPA